MLPRWGRLETFDRLFAEKVEEITGGKLSAVYLYQNGENWASMDILFPDAGMDTLI